MTPKRLAVLGLAAGLLTGGAAGLALGTPGLAGAQTDDSGVTTETTTPERADKGARLRNTLAPLVENGTLTQAQADAVIDALDAARPAFGGGRHGGHGMKGGNLEGAAGALGLTAEELRSALQGGQSLVEVANGKGIDPEIVVDALVSDIKARIAQKVTDGRITQDQADQMLSQRTERTRAFVNGEAPVFGRRGPGGHGGHGGHSPRGGQAPAGFSSSSTTSA